MSLAVAQWECLKKRILHSVDKSPSVKFVVSRNMAIISVGASPLFGSIPPQEELSHSSANDFISHYSME